MAGKRVALITGATGGLGGGMCRALLADGWTIFAHVRAAAEGRLLAEAGAHILPADLASQAQVSNLIAEVRSETSRLDVLVNNAALGYGAPQSLRRLTPDGRESRLAVNVLAPLALLNGLGDLLSSGGRVVNLASTNQEIADIDDLQLTAGWSRERSYRQSKAILLIVTEVFARRWAPRGVTVNAVHPGSRLPTKIVLESGVEPLGSLEHGLGVCVSEATATSPDTGIFVRAGEESLRIDELYPDRVQGDALVALLEGFLT